VAPETVRVLPFCNQRPDMPKGKTYEVVRDRDDGTTSVEEEQVPWIWALYFAFLAPEVMSFLRCLRTCIFKSFKIPPFLHFAFVAAMESAHVIGVAILVFLALPQLDTTHALALTNCVAFVPGKCPQTIAARPNGRILYFCLPNCIPSFLFPLLPPPELVSPR
jgi:hypothetical protein